VAVQVRLARAVDGAEPAAPDAGEVGVAGQPEGFDLGVAGGELRHVHDLRALPDPVPGMATQRIRGNTTPLVVGWCLMISGVATRPTAPRRRSAQEWYGADDGNAHGNRVEVWAVLLSATRRASRSAA